MNLETSTFKTLETGLNCKCTFCYTLIYRSLTSFLKQFFITTQNPNKDEEICVRRDIIQFIP